MLKAVIFTGIILFNASSSLANASTTSQQMLYKYETGIGSPLAKKDYLIKTDIKGCSNVFTQLQDRYGRWSTSIEVFKYCPVAIPPIGASTSTAPVKP